jgi:hypothetical protein
VVVSRESVPEVRSATQGSVLPAIFRSRVRAILGSVVCRSGQNDAAGGAGDVGSSPHADVTRARASARADKRALLW